MAYEDLAKRGCDVEARRLACLAEFKRAIAPDYATNPESQMVKSKMESWAMNGVLKALVNTNWPADRVSNRLKATPTSSDHVITKDQLLQVGIPAQHVHAEPNGQLSVDIASGPKLAGLYLQMSTMRAEHTTLGTDTINLNRKADRIADVSQTRMHGHVL